MNAFRQRLARKIDKIAFALDDHVYVPFRRKESQIIQRVIEPIRPSRLVLVVKALVYRIADLVDDPCPTCGTSPGHAHSCPKNRMCQCKHKESSHGTYCWEPVGEDNCPCLGFIPLEEAAA